MAKKKSGGTVTQVVTTQEAGQPKFTAVEKFYIEHNFQTKNVAELAADLNADAEAVQKYIEMLQKVNPALLINSMYSKGKGTVSMTAAASEDDDTRNFRVTTADIKEALAQGEFDKATKLQQKMNAQNAAQEIAQVRRAEVHNCSPGFGHG